MPKVRQPFPVESGLWGYPTSINNVETFTNVAWIILNGPAAWIGAVLALYRMHRFAHHYARELFVQFLQLASPVQDD
jgi:hypothetical protein